MNIENNAFRTTFLRHRLNERFKPFAIKMQDQLEAHYFHAEVLQNAYRNLGSEIFESFRTMTELILMRLNKLLK